MNRSNPYPLIVWLFLAGSLLFASAAAAAPQTSDHAERRGRVEESYGDTFGPARGGGLAALLQRLGTPADLGSERLAREASFKEGYGERYYGRLAQDFLRHPERYTAGGGAASSKTVATGLHDVRLSEPNETAAEFGYSVASAGDVNGDGSNDVIVGAPSIFRLGEERAFVFFGGPDMDEKADLVLKGEDLQAGFGFSVAGAGDLDGDTYSDLVVGAPLQSNVGRVYVYFGGPDLDATADLELDGGEVDGFFGASVAGAGDVVGDTHADLIVGAPLQAGTGRAYVYSGGPGMDATPELTLLGQGGADANFGWSVAGSGDVDGDSHADVMVGAPYQSGTGRVYIYSGGEIPDASADLILNGEGAGDQFGWSVAGTGDIDGDTHGDLIVGAPGHAGEVGRAYVYLGGPSLDQTADLTINGDGTYLGFGFSVDGIDVTGDMGSDLIVGAARLGSNPLTPSRAYVFLGGSSLDDVADLTLIGDFLDIAGFSVAGVEDLDGDGFSEVLTGGFAAERAYIFRGGMSLDDEIDWTLTERPDTMGNEFGISVAGVGDVNGDTYPDVVVGATGYDGYRNTGRAYLYFGGPDMDGEAGLFLDSPDPESESFGFSVAAAGDVNGDTWPDVIVGAPGGPLSITANAFIFFGGPQMDGSPDVSLFGVSSFGTSVAGAGDVNGDTYADVVVGGTEAVTVPTSGAAFIYFGGSSMDNLPDVLLSPNVELDRFGSSVAMGDVNGDTYSDVIVGSPGYNSYTGRVYVYFGGSPPDDVADLTLDGEAPDSTFGSSVAATEDLDGDDYGDVIVGAPGFDSGDGKAYVYLGGDPMDSTADLPLTGPLPGQLFGYAVAAIPDVSGDTVPDVLIGAPGNGGNTGTVFVFHGGPVMDGAFDGALNAEMGGDGFGSALAGIGDANADYGADVIVGAFSSGVNGAAYVYYGVTPPLFDKTFVTDVKGVGVATTLIFTIDNSANTQAATSLDFQDDLPTGLVVANSPNTSTTCTGGLLVAFGGQATVTYSGGTVDAGTICTVQVDVVATVPGVFDNVSQPLTSSMGSSGPARDTLTVEPAPTFDKSFAPNPSVVGGVTTLTFTLDNTASTASATSLAFTDILPPALVVATPANVANGCGGTVTAVAGSGSIALSNGAVGAGAQCALSVDVVSSAAGDHANVTGNLTSTLGNSGSATDTLRVNPPPELAMAFEPASILVGDVSTLVLEVDNSGSTVAATSLELTDTLPDEIRIADPANASTDCGGVLTAGPGTGLVSFTGGSVAGGSTCSVSVDVSSDVLGAHLNVSSTLTSALGTSDPAEATLTVEDLSPPMVTGVTTASGTLSACGNLRQPIRTIHVTIEDDRTPVLGANEASGYLLVESGPDGDFSTEGCSGVEGDDVAVTIETVTIQTVTIQEVASAGEDPFLTEVTLTVSEESLARGLYRFFVCDTITDTAGNALDGDGDSTAGGDFEVSSFRADPFNLFVNGHFDDCPLTLEPWAESATPPNTLEMGAPEVDDVSGSSLSASARIVQSDFPTSRLSQCVPVGENKTYQFEYWLRYEAPMGGLGIVVLSCEFYDAAACEGSWIDEQEVSGLLEDDGGTWIFGEQLVSTPPAAASARCHAAAAPAGTDPFFDVYVDGLFFGRSGPLQIFHDGFESGNLSAWSSETP